MLARLRHGRGPDPSRASCTTWSRTAPAGASRASADEFGAHVKSIVEQLTEDKSKTWEERKRAAIEKVPHLSPEAATVKAADKLHNLQTLLAELRAAEDQDEVWKRFNGGRERTLEQDARLVEALCTRIEPNLGRALRAAHAAVADWVARAPRPERV